MDARERTPTVGCGGPPRTRRGHGYTNKDGSVPGPHHLSSQDKLSSMDHVELVLVGRRPQMSPGLGLRGAYEGNTSIIPLRFQVLRASA